MSENNQQQEKSMTLGRLAKREQIVLKEMETLSQKGYIDNLTASKVMTGYQKYTQDQMAQLSQVETKPPVPLQVPATEKLVSKPVIRTAGPINVQPSFQETQRKVKTPEQLRERHLQIILIAGVVLLFLAGAVLATTSWLLLSPVVKVGLISLIAVVFLGMYKLAEVLKIPQTSKAFFVLSCLFFPIPFFSGAYYQLFGSYLSLNGDGRFLFGFLLTAGFAVIYGFIGVGKKIPLLTYLSMGATYVSVLFLVRSLVPWQGLRGWVILGLVFLFNHFNLKIAEKCYGMISAKKWQQYMVLVNSLTVLFSLLSFSWNMWGTIMIGLYGLLSIQIGDSLSQAKFKWLGLSDGLMAVMFFMGTSQINDYAFHWPAVVSSLLMLAYTLLREYLATTESLATAYQKLSRSYYWELIGLFMFGLTIYLLAGVSLLLCLSSLIIIGAIGVQSRKNLTAKKLINFGWLSFLLLVEFLVLVPLDKSWGLRLLMIVLLGLFNWGLRQKKVSKALGYLTASVGILYGVLWVASSVFVPVFSLVEQSVWHLLLVASLAHLALTHQSAKRKLSPILPVTLVFAMIPLAVHSGEILWSIFTMGLVVLGLAQLVHKKFARSLMVASHGVSLFLFGISSLLLIANSVLAYVSWAHIIIPLFGIYLMYSCGIWLHKQLFFNTLPLFIFWTLLFPLNLWQLADFSLLIYFSLLLVGSYFLLQWNQQQKIEYLGQIGLGIVVVISGCLSLLQTALISDIQFSFIGLLPVMIILGLYYYQAKNTWLKRGLLLVESYLFIVLLQLSLSQLFETWLETQWQFFILTSLLTLGLLWKGERPVIWPIGLVNVGIALLIFLLTSFNQQVSDWSVLGGSLLLLSYGTIYLLLAKVPQVQQLSLLLTLGYTLLLSLSRSEASSGLFRTLVWGLLVISIGLHLWQRQSLRLGKTRWNLVIPVQLIGIFGLAFLAVDDTWIKLYVLLVAGGLGYIEVDSKSRRSLQTVASITGYLLVYDGLATYLMPQNSLLANFIINFTVLIGITGILRFIWHSHKVARLSEWFVSGIILLSYLLMSLYGSLTISLYGAVFALLLVVGAYLTKYTAYFVNGLIYLVIFLLYSQRHFWAAVPWWLYLALGGILLIALGSLSEWNRRKQSVSKFKVKEVVKGYFKDWQ